MGDNDVYLICFEDETKFIFYENGTYDVYLTQHKYMTWTHILTNKWKIIDERLWYKAANQPWAVWTFFSDDDAAEQAILAKWSIENILLEDRCE